MVLARQLYRRRAAFAAEDQAVQIFRAEVRRQGEEFAVRETAAPAVMDVRAAQEVLHLGEPFRVELRLVTPHRGQLLLERVADVHDEGAMPVPLLGVERER